MLPRDALVSSEWRKRICQMKMTQEISEPKGIAQMVCQTAEAVTFLAVDEVEPGELAAESGLAIILQRVDHGNEINALDPLRELHYSHVMSITQIGRYRPPLRFPSRAQARCSS